MPRASFKISRYSFFFIFFILFLFFLFFHYLLKIMCIYFLPFKSSLKIHEKKKKKKINNHFKKITMLHSVNVPAAAVDAGFAGVNVAFSNVSMPVLYYSLITQDHGSFCCICCLCVYYIICRCTNAFNYILFYSILFYKIYVSSKDREPINREVHVNKNRLDRDRKLDC